MKTKLSLEEKLNSQRTDSAAHLYLQLLKNCLTRIGFESPYFASPIVDLGSPIWNNITKLFLKELQKQGYVVCRQGELNRQERIEGRVLPDDQAETMIGLHRLDNLQQCIEYIISHHIPGDLIEAGAWRGGASIFMRAALKAYGVKDRIVFVADSFQGFPEPNAQDYPLDAINWRWLNNVMSISIEKVRENFNRYGLLDEQVCFLPGWFKDTLPEVPTEKFSLIRLDGDMYESTIEGLSHLYPKLSMGGFCIIDDYGCLSQCKQAVDDYRQQYGITEELIQIDWTGYYWQRQTSV